VLTLDASVWVNADSPHEPGYSDSRALLDLLSTTGATIVEPTLLPVEIAGVISRTRNDNTLAHEVAAALLSLPSIRWIQLDQAIARQAAALAAAHRLRGADAVYAAVALAHGCDLVSLDHEHLNRLSAVVRTLTPSDALANLQTAPPPT